ncbi:MAG: transcriptional regulator [Burkholderiales bacterium]|nr:transcriptional regulator [Burkholderiales bacterium]
MARKTVEIEMVKNEASYRRAVLRLTRFFDQPPKAGSSEDAEFELLMLMVERYETEHHDVSPPDPVAAIEFAIEQRGLTPRDLQAIFGSRQRVHEVLRRKRRLSMEQARALHEKLAIPAEVLIQAY